MVRDPAVLERHALIRAVMCDFQVELSEARGRGWCEGLQRASARMRRSSDLNQSHQVSLRLAPKRGGRLGHFVVSRHVVRAARYFL